MKADRRKQTTKTKPTTKATRRKQLTAIESKRKQPKTRKKQELKATESKREQSTPVSVNTLIPNCLTNSFAQSASVKAVVHQ
jgi:hypothetical protein